jgi:aspartyl/glutamyl-tRNA(Asn/Gln) amidotransferase C subunit
MTQSKITTDDIKKVMFLSRLGTDMAEEYVAAYQKDLSEILDMAIELSEVKGIESQMLYYTTIADLREDEQGEDKERYERVRKNIIHNFPKSNANMLILPGIFEES